VHTGTTPAPRPVRRTTSALPIYLRCKQAPNVTGNVRWCGGGIALRADIDRSGWFGAAPHMHAHSRAGLTSPNLYLIADLVH